MPKTRQQRRARSRSPLKKRSRSGMLFTVAILVLVAGGVAAAMSFRANPPPLTRGASIGEHWHASYEIHICGQRMSNYPNMEGEVHSHGDGFIHVHPHTQAFAGDNANLGAFLRFYQTQLVQAPDGTRTLMFPDGTSYTDGDTCPDGEAYEIEVTNRGRPVEGDPSQLIIHDGDVIAIKFGPEGEEIMPNPFSTVHGIPEAPPPGADGPAPEGDDAPLPEEGGDED